jgi:KDO2-lipid IV(A) lauroyltransferase
MRYYCETFLLPRWDRARIGQLVRTENEAPVRKALESGGIILTLPHMGNWDLAGAWAAKEFGSLCTVAERLRPEGIYRKFLRVREEAGITLRPLTGEAGIYEYLRDSVTSGKVVALLGDRDVARNGMGNEFFNHRASLPVGAAMLALDTGRPLFSCAAWYDGDTMVISFDDQIHVDQMPPVGRERLRAAQEVTAKVAHNFEKHVRAHPDNWHMLQPVWSDLTAVGLK